MPEASVNAWIAHQLPGRVRIRLVGKHGEDASIKACAEQVRVLPGVRAVDARAVTGSLLILHDGPFEPIGQEAASRGLFVLGNERQEPGLDFSALVAAVPPTVAVAGGLAALATIQLSRGSILPPAITLLWYAASLVRHADAPHEPADDVASDD